MSKKSPTEFCDKSFDGVTRLFPLPGLVMFPHIVQALHIFEPRYRDLLEDAMRGDKLIAMALLARGWEKDHQGSPPVENTVCLGQIVSRTRLDDGCSNILLIGLRRARIIREFNNDASFRTAEIELMYDEYTPEDDQCSSLLHELMNAFQERMPRSALAADQLTQALGNDVTLAVLTDLIAYSIQISTAKKLCLLSETHVDRRAQQLLNHLSQVDVEQSAPAQGHNGGFPPDFSAN